MMGMDFQLSYRYFTGDRMVYSDLTWDSYPMKSISSVSPKNMDKLYENEILSTEEVFYIVRYGYFDFNGLETFGWYWEVYDKDLEFLLSEPIDVKELKKAKSIGNIHENSDLYLDLISNKVKTG